MRDFTSGGLRDEKARGFGRWLRVARKRVGFTQEESAGKARLSRSVVAFADPGARLSQPRNRRKLTDTLDANLEELWG